MDKAATDALKRASEVLTKGLEAAKPVPITFVARKAFDVLVVQFGLEGAVKAVDEMAKETAKLAQPQPLPKVVDQVREILK